MPAELFSINDLAARVNAWCAEHRIEPANGQSGDQVSERNIRFYRTAGLVDAPASGGAGYGEKHFLQLTDMRLLQAQGIPLRRIRELLFGRTTAELREIQRRGVAEAKGAAAARTPMPAGDELWRMLPLNEDFLIVSRRGRQFPLNNARRSSGCSNPRVAPQNPTNTHHEFTSVRNPNPVRPHRVARRNPDRSAAQRRGMPVRCHRWRRERRVRSDLFSVLSSAPLDCTYTFPLPAEAAVFRCEMHINGRVIAAHVEERREAKRIFEEQKAAGRRAAMVELERENLFTLSLGNAQPGDVIVIRLAYFQTLERASESLSLRIPVCPGVRYIPGKPLLRSLSGRGTADDTDQVPDAFRISPPRIDALHPDAAYFSAEGKIVRSDVAEDSLSSPTHPVLIHADETALHLALAEHGAVPDRDLVLRWKEPREIALQPRGWVCEKDGERYALVQLRAPANVAVSATVAHDYYFLVDRSGSMGGAKWIKTCEALTAFVKLLGASDRVWITLFESHWSDYAEKPMPAPAVLRDKGFHDLVNLGVAGGTELRPAAEHVRGQDSRTFQRGSGEPHHHHRWRGGK